jgi:hypothetical protein
MALISGNQQKKGAAIATAPVWEQHLEKKNDDDGRPFIHVLRAQ